MQHQVIEWNLPPAPAKEGDSRTKNWDGIGQVELDAIEPRKLQRMCQDAINEFFDYDLFEELNEIEERERSEYKKEMINFINGLNI
jgi:hypothetical protein